MKLSRYKITIEKVFLLSNIYNGFLSHDINSFRTEQLERFRHYDLRDTSGWKPDALHGMNDCWFDMRDGSQA
jgi:hypothetical protein